MNQTHTTKLVKSDSKANDSSELIIFIESNKYNKTRVVWLQS